MLINPNISEIKKEYTDFLLDILTPLLHEGIQSIYKNSIEQHNRILEKNKNSIKSSPGILKIFQTQLKEIPSLNTHKIHTETNRIKESSKCSSWFDNLIKAVIKSNIMLLTMEDQSSFSNNYHEDIKTEDFIHKCYISCAKLFYSNPYLFWHEYDNHKIKKNQHVIVKNIKKGIKDAIRCMLPIKDILNEYLSNEYVDQYDNNYNLIRRSVEKILKENENANSQPYYNKINTDVKATGDSEIKVCYVNKQDIDMIKNMEHPADNDIERKDNIVASANHLQDNNYDQNQDLFQNLENKTPEHVSDKKVATVKNNSLKLDDDTKLQSFINNSKKKIILDFNGYDKKGNAINKKPQTSNEKDKYFAQYF